MIIAFARQGQEIGHFSKDEVPALARWDGWRLAQAITPLRFIFRSVSLDGFCHALFPPTYRLLLDQRVLAAGLQSIVINGIALHATARSI